MRLEKFNMKETKKPLEEPQIHSIIEDIKRFRDSLPLEDIDQEWVRKNEGKEFSPAQSKQDNSQQLQATPPPNNNPKLKDVLAQMESVGSFGKPKTSEEKIESVEDEFAELLGDLSTTNTQQITTPEPTPIASAAEKKENEDSPGSIPPMQPPVSDSESIEPEEMANDTNALIEELSDRINRKYNRLMSELSSLYNAQKIHEEAEVIKKDIQTLMAIKEKSIEELTKIDDGLNKIISRFASLSQRADEVKKADDFRIMQQQKQQSFFMEYQMELMQKYGNYWFVKMTEPEKEKYTTLYMSAYNVSRENVEKQIEDSKARAYNEMAAEEEQKRKAQTMTTGETVFKGKFEAKIKEMGKEAVANLKQIYSGLNMATPEQIEEFKYLYSTLSTLGKVGPQNAEEELQYLHQLYEISERINQFQDSLYSSGPTLR